jgi:hypothetical protein
MHGKDDAIALCQLFEDCPNPPVILSVINVAGAMEGDQKISSPWQSEPLRRVGG